MKTNISILNSTGRSNKTKIIVTLIGRNLAFLALLLLSNPLFSQTVKQKHTSWGFGLFSQVSGNGYGTAYAPSIYYKSGRKGFSAGPLVQKLKAHMSGVQVRVTYALTGADVPSSVQEDYNPNLELYLFISGAYNHAAFLNKRTLQEESCTHQGASENSIENRSFRSAEVYAGMGLKIRFLERFKWVNCIGVGGYTSLDYPEKMNLFYDRSSVGLILRTGITYDFNP